MKKLSAKLWVYTSTLMAFLFLSSTLQAQSCEKLIWSDEFDGTELDLSKWNFDLGNGCGLPAGCGWGNAELQYYTDSPNNVSVSDGKLIITAREEAMAGMDYTAARIHTKNKGDFRYGRIEARIKLPETQGMWPAFWMLSTDQVYGEWPRSGEIDILELLGHEPETVIGTVHTGLPWVFHDNEYTLTGGETFADDFHIFNLEWSADTLKWSIDGNLYSTQTSTNVTPWEPFLENFHLILNIAVGGNWPGSPDASTVFPQTMEVDYIRVYNTLDQLQIIEETAVSGQSGVNYNTYDIEGAEYIWTVPGDATIISGEGTASIEVDWGCSEGDVSLELRTDCDTIIINNTVAFEALEVAGALEVAPNEEGLSFSIPAIAGATYDWAVPGDASISEGQGTNSILVDWACVNGEVSVTINSDCYTDEVVSLVVDLRAYSISGLASVMPNAMGIPYSIEAIPGATYTWTVPDGASVVSGEDTNSILVDFSNQPGTVSVDVTTSCGTETITFDVIIDESFLYVDYDGTDLLFSVFGGGYFEKIENPVPGGINTSGHVGLAQKEEGAQPWGGIFADLGFEMILEDNHLLNMKVYSEATGIVKFKIEDQTDGADPIELDVDYTDAGQWIDMVWDFEGAPDGTFDRIALFFGFNDTDTTLWYFDDILGTSDESTSTGSIEVSTGIKVFPNPGNDIISLSMENAFEAGTKLAIQLFDVEGKLWKQQQVILEENPIDLNVKSLASGTYILKIKSKNKYYIKKVMKQ